MSVEKILEDLVVRNPELGVAKKDISIAKGAYFSGYSYPQRLHWHGHFCPTTYPNQSEHSG